MHLIALVLNMILRLAILKNYMHGMKLKIGLTWQGLHKGRAIIGRAPLDITTVARRMPILIPFGNFLSLVSIQSPLKRVNLKSIGTSQWKMNE